MRLQAKQDRKKFLQLQINYNSRTLIMDTLMNLSTTEQPVDSQEQHCFTMHKLEPMIVLPYEVWTLLRRCVSMTCPCSTPTSIGHFPTSVGHRSNCVTIIIIIIINLNFFRLVHASDTWGTHVHCPLLLHTRNTL